MATKMKLPIIVLCIFSIVLTIGLVFLEKGRFSGTEELSTFECYSEELSFEEVSSIEEVQFTFSGDIETTQIAKNVYAPLVEGTTKKAVEIIVEEDPTFNTEDGEYQMYFTDSDVRMIAKTIYGEAGSSWISRENKAKVAWVILNRVDDPNFPSTIAGVVTAPNQFHGYISSYPVTDLCYEIAKDVLTRWSMEKQGANIYRELPRNINAFYGDGRQNHFYEAKW